MSNHTVQAAAEGMPTPDILALFDPIEYRARDIKNLAFAALHLGNDGFSADAAEGRTFTIPRGMGEAMLSMARMAEDQAEMLEADIDRVRDAVRPLIVKTARPDPLLHLIEAYQRGLDAEAAAGDLSDEDAEKLADSTWKPSWSVLTSDKVPAPTTLEGVAAAVRLIRDDERQGRSYMTEPVMTAVLTFFEERAVR